MALQTFLTGPFIFAVIVFIIFLIVGSGGGFGTLFNLGNTLSKIPIWVYVVGLGLWLFSQMRGK